MNLKNIVWKIIENFITKFYVIYYNFYKQIENNNESHRMDNDGKKEEFSSVDIDNSMSNIIT